MLPLAVHPCIVLGSLLQLVRVGDDGIHILLDLLGLGLSFSGSRRKLPETGLVTIVVKLEKHV